ncbi:MAG: tRNA 2-thiouridine(34) synthase MnmA [Elusimicrobia bacterium]|nr:tRNA 2-thiouridine(34) synthase MnmA [Elusimicrobiota bacterium]
MRVLALMSGGVDSSATAYLLKKEGHEVVGATLKLFELSKEGPGCCGSPRDVYDAKDCARMIGIPHYTLDETEAFQKGVIDVFKRSYEEGETPNPCVECNRSMKFGPMLELAESWGFDAVATGHYARIGLNEDEKSLSLYRAHDERKDQSYFLYMLKDNQLSRILFPLGGLKKTEVRAIAEEAGLPTAQKAESQEICFVGAMADGDYRNLLNHSDQAGPIIEQRSGRVLGRHQGYFNYTIGQRGGLGVSVGEPLYVTAIDPAQKTVYVGADDELLRSEISVADISWVHGDAPGSRIPAQVKIRSKSPAVEAMIEARDGLTAMVRFNEPQRAPTPGQFAVFYDDVRVLGGGKITHAR